MTPSDRYDTSGMPEGQYEPGSNGRVLKNLLGISSLDELEVAETAELWFAEEKLLAEVRHDQSFTAQDICAMHRLWLGRIYPWAGKYRHVNLGKDGFPFAMAHAIPFLMAEFEREQLKRYTPCIFTDRDAITRALAEVHVELMLIHPFREGNGRLGRLLATLMGLQAGLPLLDFSEMAGCRKEEYFAAVRAGMDKNYRPMARLFADVIELSSR
ncbi:Fic/DOC family protein [Geothermobacter hydrogeniphilus]|uniref:protein adenylyltransferase n=1 Tax=Geothermobacter hydrogeniphilus TaxID=1969733 RepID=A0A1X0XLC1_9BACT|nr:Fic family protein [Geothermobacter hydrogeniphilus]ORJ53699.1 cell filamentation protein Fic [Geothermobacter hydrogeniphilus]